VPWVPIVTRPSRWFICFRKSSPTWWIDAFAGRYKHVAAFGHIPGQELWLFYGWSLVGTEMLVIPDRHATGSINAMIADCVVVEYDPPADPHVWKRWHPVNSCVSKIADMVGIPSSALRPTGFLRDCLRHGGRIVIDGTDRNDGRPGFDRDAPRGAHRTPDRTQGSAPGEAR